jgi:hypothetical protein
MKQTLPYPDWLISATAGLKEGRSCREKHPLPDSKILVFRDSAKNLDNLSNQFAVSSHRQFEFQKRSQLFIGVHNEPLTVAAVCVGNPDCSLARIHG